MEPARQPDGTGSCVCGCQTLGSPYINMFISCSFYTAESLTGCDASGHIAEETRHAKYIRPLLPKYL